MTDRPIIFSGPMVRALLAGRKTQTRRLLSPRPSLARPDRFQLVGKDRRTGRAAWEAWADGAPCNAFPAGDGCCTSTFYTAGVGDRLFVREAHRLTDCPCTEACRSPGNVYYEADGEGYQAVWRNRLRPSIHMPRWASRLTLIVEAVRVEQLEAISEADARAEGPVIGKASGRAYDSIAALRLGGPEWRNARDWYADLWDSLHTKPGERWGDNPAVVALTFRVIRANIDQVPA